ncbi:hypothetical protein KSS87_000536 [Heliosperma pusillum]|nr:hypothetical protein KSS87_000536 [Heliosperma pusillum]
MTNLLPMCLFRKNMSFYLLGALLVFGVGVVSAQPSVHNASKSRWNSAVATWYGEPNGDGSSGGACGYGSLVDVKPFKGRVGAVNPILFKSGEGCGACYKVRCLDKTICSKRAVTVIITDECPGCSRTSVHFDLSGAAFGRMAFEGEGGHLRNRGILNIKYVKTACKYPGKTVAFRVNEGSTDYWLSLMVEYEDGDGDVGSMQIKQNETPNGTEDPHFTDRGHWISFQHVPTPID